MAIDPNSLILGTRKGLMQLSRTNGRWKVARESFRGQPVSYAISDERTGALWAGLDHGHWGTKLHRSTDGGATWRELTAPVYPEGGTGAAADRPRSAISG